MLQNNYLSHWILQLILEIRILHFPEFSNQIVSDEKKGQLQILFDDKFGVSELVFGSDGEQDKVRPKI